MCLGDLEKLTGEITFACNNIYLAFPDTSWRPTYYTVSDPLAAETFASTIAALSVDKIFSSSVRKYFKTAQNITWLQQIDYASDDDLSDFAFSFDLTQGVYHGATTLYIQLQLAFYMGVEEVYLLGVDFDYKIPAQTGQRSGLGVMVVHQEESNHFHPHYRQPNERWWLADKEFQQKTYSFADSVFKAHGRSICNASRRTVLDIFPLADFDKILSQGHP